jgi:hypothetical protein
MWRNISNEKAYRKSEMVKSKRQRNKAGKGGSSGDGGNGGVKKIGGNQSKSARQPGVPAA